jgi:hypothetical protein
MTVIVADPDRDNGDPQETTTQFHNDPSWDAEIAVFADAIIKDISIESGSSTDAFYTMQLVHRIYFADAGWRDRFGIPSPEINMP